MWSPAVSFMKTSEPFPATLCKQLTTSPSLGSTGKTGVRCRGEGLVCRKGWSCRKDYVWSQQVPGFQAQLEHLLSRPLDPLLVACRALPPSRIPTPQQREEPRVNSPAHCLPRVR